MDIKLFSDTTSHDSKNMRLLSVQEELKNIPADTILATPETDLINFVVQKHLPEVPHILREQVYTDEPYECNLDYGYQFGDRHIVKGTAITAHIPFEGDAIFFKMMPSIFELTTYRADSISSDNRIICTFLYSVEEYSNASAKINSYITSLEKYLERLRNDFTDFEYYLKRNAMPILSERKTRLLAQKKMTESLPFPIKRRDSGPTYNIDVRKKIVPELPTVKTPFQPEPTLTSSYYEEILGCLARMSLVMEQSPSSFINMKEEDLRSHFLVQLNSSFQVDAGGETFNLGGKTDILLRSGGHNIFIAELKFWGGAKLLTETIDQLLEYVCWRDTKTAILIFNKNKNLSSVLEQIPTIVTAHPNYKRQEKYGVSTGFRFIMKNKNDANKEFMLTLLCFDLPKK